MSIPHMQHLSAEEELSAINSLPIYDKAEYIQPIGDGFAIVTATCGVIYLRLSYDEIIDYYIRQDNIHVFRWQSLYSSYEEAFYAAGKLLESKTGQYAIRQMFQIIAGREYKVLHGDDRNLLLGQDPNSFDVYSWGKDFFQFKNTWTLNKIEWNYWSFTEDLELCFIQEFLVAPPKITSVVQSPLLVVGKDITEPITEITSLPLLGTPLPHKRLGNNR